MFSLSSLSFPFLFFIFLPLFLFSFSLVSSTSSFLSLHFPPFFSFPSSPFSRLTFYFSYSEFSLTLSVLSYPSLSFPASFLFECGRRISRVAQSFSVLFLCTFLVSIPHHPMLYRSSSILLSSVLLSYPSLLRSSSPFSLFFPILSSFFHSLFLRFSIPLFSFPHSYPSLSSFRLSYPSLPRSCSPFSSAVSILTYPSLRASFSYPSLYPFNSSIFLPSVLSHPFLRPSFSYPSPHPFCCSFSSSLSSPLLPSIHPFSVW